MTRKIAVLTLSLVMLGALPARAQDNAPAPRARPTMTVADFDTDRTGWVPPPGLGITLAELLTNRLVDAGPFRMVDRQWIVSETNEKGRVPFDLLLDRAAGAGVDFLVVGSVTRFSKETKTSRGGGFFPLPFIGGLFRKSKTESVIGLTLRVIDVRTGEVVATALAESGASQQQKRGGGVAVVGHIPVFGAGGTSVTGFHDRLLDQAAQQAVGDAAARIVSAAPRIARNAGDRR